MESGPATLTLCMVEVVWTNSTGATIRRMAGKDSTLALCRDGREQLCLWVKPGKHEDLALALTGGVALHGQCVFEGRGTVRLVAQMINIFISKADPPRLKLWLATFAEKLKIAPVAPPLRDYLSRGPLRAEAPTSLSSVSPPKLTALDTLNRSIPRCPFNGGSPPAKRRQFTGCSVQSTSSSGLHKPCNTEVDLSDLSVEQRKVFELAMSGTSLFFSGGAGTGKSFVLKKILASLPRETTMATGPTGVAACHIGGTTLHKFAGLRQDGTLPREPSKVFLCNCR